jgi:hypothetical protein
VVVVVVVSMPSDASRMFLVMSRSLSFFRALGCAKKWDEPSWSLATRVWRGARD